MSWFQKNSFPFAVLGVTLLGVAGLFYYGKQGGARYEAAKTNFDMAVAEASTMEKTVPYPTAPNLNGKKKAIEEFKKDVESLQQAFDVYRAGELSMVSPQEFIDRLIEVNKETRKQFELNAVAVPESYFVGFKEYTGKLPPKNATGILGYQLEAIRGLLLTLAGSGATELKNLHRPVLDEESGTPYQPAAGVVARPLALEMTFKCPERTLRKLMSEIAKNENHFWVVRSLRIGNERMEPPKTADAKFGTPAARPNQREGVFDELFRPEQEGNPDAAEKPQDGALPAPEGAPAPPPPPAAQAPGGERILALILGNEQLIVHMRLDLMMFLEPSPLP